MPSLTREDSTTIGFVCACYFSNAISTAELNEWAEHIMVSATGYPDYIVDLREFDAPRFHFYKVLGFNPDRDLSDLQREAIDGIAYMRGREALDAPPKEHAISALNNSPEIAEEFSKTFPFIHLQQV